MTPVEGLWGVGLSLLSEPNRDGYRTSIGVYDTEVENAHFDLDALKKDTADYYQGRKDWLSNLEGSKWIGEIPFEPFRTKNGADGYRIGFKYELGGVAQSQTSYYLVCNQRIFLVKGATALSGGKAEQEKIEQVVSGFRCERDEARISGRKITDIKDAWRRAKENRGAKIQAIAALRDFMVDYSEAFRQVSSTEAAKDERYAEATALLNRLVRKYLFRDAEAGNDDPCFFAGWISEWAENDQGKITCKRPAGADGCGDGKIACNPLLFGKVCLDADFKQSATLACNTEYKREKEKRDAEITAELSAHPGDLDAIAASADQLCSSESYRTSNYGLCQTLYNRVAQIDPATAKKFSAELPPPEQIQPGDYDNVAALAQDQMKLLDSVCYADASHTSLLPAVKVEGSDEVIDCVKLKDETLANLRALDRIAESKEFIASQRGHGTCDHCGDDANPVQDPLGDQSGFVASTKKLANACTQDEIKKQSCTFGDFACIAASSVVPPPITTAMGLITPNLDLKGCNPSQDSCSQRAFSGLVEALWGMVKGVAVLAKDVVGGLVHDGAHAALNVGKKVLNWFGASMKIEDASSYKTVQLMRTAGGFLGDFIKAPGATMSKLMTGIWNAIQDWMKNDVFCEKWSGIPHLSSCLQPSTSFACTPCKDKVLGSCTAVGYVASYFAGMILTGGVSNAAKAISESATVLKILANASDIGAAVATKFPNLARAAKFTVKVGKTTAKGAGYVGSKVGKVVKLPFTVIKGTIRLLEKIPVVKVPIRIVKGKVKALIELHNRIATRSYELGRSMTDGFARRVSGSLASREMRVLQSTANKVAKADQRVQRLEAELTPEKKKAIDALTEARKDQAGIRAEHDLVANARKSIPAGETLATQESALREAEIEIQKTQAELDAVNKRIPNRKISKPSLSQKVKSLGSSRSANDSALDDIDQDLAKQGELEKKLAKATKTRDDLKIEVEAKRKDFAETDQYLEGKRAELKAKEDQIKQLKKSVGGSDQSVAKLEKAQQELRDLKAKYESALNDAKNKPVKGPPKIEAKNIQLEGAQKRYSEATARVEEQQKIVDDAKASLARGRSNDPIADLFEEREGLAQAERERAALKLKLKEAEPVSGARQEKILNQLNGDLAVAKNDLQLVEDRIAKNPTANPSLENTRKHFENKVNTIEKEIGEKTQDFKTQTVHYEDRKKELALKEDEVNQRKEKVDQLRASAKSAKKSGDSVAAEEKKLAKLRKEQKGRRKAVEDLEKERTEIASSLLGDQGADLMNTVSKAEEAISTHTARLAEIDAELDASRARTLKPGTTPAQLKDEKELQDELNAWKITIQQAKEDAQETLSNARPAYRKAIQAPKGAGSAPKVDRELIAIKQKEVAAREKELSGLTKALKESQRNMELFKEQYGDLKLEPFPKTKPEMKPLDPSRATEWKGLATRMRIQKEISQQLEVLTKETERLRTELAAQKDALAKMPGTQSRAPSGAKAVPLVPALDLLRPKEH